MYIYWCVDLWICWCVSALACWCADVLVCWGVVLLICWCIGVAGLMGCKDATLACGSLGVCAGVSV